MKRKTLSKIFNPAVWGVASLFFTIALTIFVVGKEVVIENEGNINYALGIDPYEKVQDGDSNTEYYVSDFKKEDGSYDDKAMRQNSIDVTRKVDNEGMVLLWNKNNALPLKENSQLSFFGVSSRAKNWLYSGHGSGRVSVTTSDFADLKETFESENKFKVNSKLYNSYQDKTYYKVLSGLTHQNNNGVTPSSGPEGADNHYREFQVNEKAWNEVNNEANSTFAEYGDAAIYFITRTGAEDGDTWFDTSKNSSDQHADNNYLDLTKNEQDTLKALQGLKRQGVFKKVVLVLNTGTPLQMKNIMNYDIDACLWAGMGGNASFLSIYDVMSGKVNPSGKLVDTYAYDNYSAPSTVNLGAYEFMGRTGSLPEESRGSNAYNHAYIVYQEGIYVGYRYYETRYEDSVLNRGNAKGNAGVKMSDEGWNYSKEVAFPFGHGESYTDFEFSNYAVDYHDDIYTISVDVKNTGDVPGKTPIQVYLQKPYTEYDKTHNIEKAAVELVGFTKTDILEPNETKNYKIDVSKYEFKTYDSYNEKTYILEPTNNKDYYYLSIGDNSHDALNNILAKKGYDQNDGMVDIYGTKTNGNANLSEAISIDEKDYHKYSKSIVNPDVEITNQFDDADLNLYEGTKDQHITYLSRNDWDATYPKKYVELTASNRKFVADMQYSSKIEEDPNAKMPTYGANNGITLAMLKDLGFDDKKWDSLLDQLTWQETVELCGIGNHIINACPSISSPSATAHDGPAGVHYNDLKYTELTTQMCFPNGVLLASTFNTELIEEFGKAFGHELLHCNVTEIYGTGAGMHRSAFGGRNWEYFSEDGFISSKTLASEVIGLQSKGVITNIKHLVLNDQEIYRCGGTTWANEQSIREIYLKGFEYGITEGHANGVMSSLNRIGATWAGRHKGLLTNVLRNEWGFVGLVETDAATGIYMRQGDARANAVIAGNDLWLRGSNNKSELWGDYENNPTVCNALRNSAKNILYTILHSSAMNGVDSSTRFVKVTPWYFNAIDTGKIISGVITREVKK